jgi:tRNA threonylcarbamoyladenosine biosynthesis protein TsaE
VKKTRTLEIVVRSPAELEMAAPRVLEALGTRRKVALYGPMGAGKTTLVSAICQWLGAGEQAASPTFSLINEYRYTDKNGATALVHHLDLYRLQSENELYDIGITEVLDDPWYCFIEWPQLAENWLPDDAASIFIEVLDDQTRLINIQAG